MATVCEAFAIAVQHHQASRLHAAEQIYQQILAVVPNHADAWHLQRGSHLMGIDFIGRAVGLNPNVSAFHCNLGNVYLALKQWAQTAACYRRALQLKPDFVEAHNNLGTTFTRNLEAEYRQMWQRWLQVGN